MNCCRKPFALLASMLTIYCNACDSATQPRVPLTSELAVVVSSRDRVLTAFVADTPSRKFTVGLGPDGGPVSVAVRGAFAAVPLGTVNAVTVVNLREQRVTQTVALPAGSGATGAAFINDSIVLVGNPNLNTVSPVNVLRGTRGTDLPVGRFPQSIITVGDTAYVINAELGSNFQPVGPGTVTVLVGYPSQNAGTIRLTGINPGAGALRADGTLAVVNSGRFGASDGSISIVNRRTLTETQRIAGAGEFPGAVAFDASGRLVVAAFGYGLAVYDLAGNAFTRAPANAVKPGGVAGSSGVGFDSQGRLYSLKPDCANPSSVYRLTQAFDVDVEIPVGICPIAIAFTRVERTP
jgi:hypothetical protein